MPTLYRLQVIHVHKGGLPEDSVVNTFWCRATGDGSAAEAEACAERVRDFYVSTIAGNPAPLNGYMSPTIALAGHQIKVTPIDEATGVDTRGLGQPALWAELFDHVGRTEPADGYPSEIAVGVSFKNNSAALVPPARRRGRIYFGPVTPAVSTVETTTDRRTVSSLVRGYLVTAADWLRDNLAADGNAWVIYSRPFAGRPETPRPGRTTLPELPPRIGFSYPVEQIWVDDAFDVQRRRGEKAVARTTGASVTVP